MHFLTESFLVFALAFGVLFFWLDLRSQKILLLGASLYYCGSQDWGFAGLLIVSILMNHLAALAIEREAWRRAAMWAGIAGNLALLGVFKYFNFFLGSFADGLGYLGVNYSAPILQVAVPLGLSFYTMQAISYLVDLRDGKLERASLFDFAVYMAFWPKFVAGPIIRAESFLPQLRKRRVFRWANLWLGIEMIIYGLLLKTLLSDYLAPHVNRVYASPDAFDAANTLLAALFFTLQIYGDFAGYSLVVIGIARILGFSIRPNFRRPNFARSFSDFWKRWHISLSSWLDDYIFRRMIPKHAGAHDFGDSVAEIYALLLERRDVKPQDSFTTLSGDSLSFVQVSIALEDYLGHLPDDWNHMTIAQLESLRADRVAAE